MHSQKYEEGEEEEFKDANALSSWNLWFKRTGILSWDVFLIDAYI